MHAIKQNQKYQGPLGLTFNGHSAENAVMEEFTTQGKGEGEVRFRVVIVCSSLLVVAQYRPRLKFSIAVDWVSFHMNLSIEPTRNVSAPNCVQMMSACATPASAMEPRATNVDVNTDRMCVCVCVVSVLFSLCESCTKYEERRIY